MGQKPRHIIAKPMKCLEHSIGQNLHVEFVNDFLNMTSKAQTTKLKLD